MKKLKYLLTVLVVAVAATAQADLVFDDEYPPFSPNNPPTEEAFIEGIFAADGMPMDFVFLGRFGPGGSISGGEDPFGLLAGGNITVTGYDNSDDTSVELSWDLTGTGFELWDVLLKSGQVVTNYFVTADQRITDGPGSQTAISTNEGTGGGRGISHISFFGKAATTTVPEGGATAALMGLALAGLALIKRRRS